jgi:hypothetical protein
MGLEVIGYIREKLIGSPKILLKELLRYVKVIACQRHPDGANWARYTGHKLSNDGMLKQLRTKLPKVPSSGAFCVLDGVRDQSEFIDLWPGYERTEIQFKILLIPSGDYVQLSVIRRCHRERPVMA